MGTVLAVVAAYLIGAKTGSENLDEVVRSLNAIRESDEFKGLMKAMRAHAAVTLRQVAGMLDGAPSAGGDSGDLVDRVMKLVEPSDRG